MNAADRPWAEAAAATIDDLVAEVRHRADAADKDVGADAVHDMRTATRRLRTAITIYRDVIPKRRRAPILGELREVAHRLGSVRDLDILIESLEKSDNGHGDDGSDLVPLRDAWVSERQRSAGRLTTELGRRRFERSLKRLSKLANRRKGTKRDSDDGPAVPKVAYRAPGLIWDAFGELLAFDLDAKTADPAAIHQMRIAAKKLRYTLEAFEDALVGAGTLIEEVTALQDAAGEMHDATVARDRARSFHDRDGSRPERRAISAFATAQGRRAQACQGTVSRRLATVRSRAFLRSLDRVLLAMVSRR